MPGELPEDVQQTIDDFAAEISSVQVDTPTGPMPGENSQGARNVTVKGDVTTRREYIPDIGEVVVVAVELTNYDPDTYTDHLNQLTSSPQVSYGEAVYAVMEQFGISVPRGTKELGVRIRPANPDPFPETVDVSNIASALGVETSEVKRQLQAYAVTDSRDLLEEKVVVEGYIPLGNGAVADGGLSALFHGAENLVWLAGAAGPFLGMARLLNDLGEEYSVKTNLDAVSLTVGLYDDAAAGATGDAISDTSDLAALTSEPSTGNYATQSAAMSAADISGNWGIDNDAAITFDVTNTTGPVDSWYAQANFQAVDTADGAATNHLVCTGALSQEYDLGNLTSLEISTGDGSGSGVGWYIT